MSAPTFVRSGEAGAPPAPGELRISGLGRRAAAVLLDASIVCAAWALILAVIWLATGADADFWGSLFEPPTDDPSAGALLTAAGVSLLMLVLWTAYTGRFTSRADGWNGQTPGKRAAGLRIVTRDGRPLPGRTAWRRVLVVGALGLPGVLGPLVDLAIGDGTLGTDVGSYLSVAASTVVLLFVLRGDLRQTAYDAFVGTLVVDVPSASAAAPGAGPGTHGQAPSPVTTLEQSRTETDAVIVPRRRTAKTWIAVLGTVLLSASVIPLSMLELPEDRSDEILALPETQDALGQLRQLETLAVACLADRGDAGACDEPAELNAPTGITFSDDFDVERDPIGAQAGKVGIVAEGQDTLYLYAFTSVDRIWASVVEGDDLEHVCFKSSSDDLCDGVFEW